MTTTDVLLILVLIVQILTLIQGVFPPMPIPQNITDALTRNTQVVAENQQAGADAQARIRDGSLSPADAASIAGTINANSDTTAATTAGIRSALNGG